MKLKKHVTSELYFNVLIEKNGAYTSNYDKFRVIAFTPDVERYFKTIKDAKQYIKNNLDCIQHIQEDDVPF